MALPRTAKSDKGLSLLETVALDMLAEGKTARQISDHLGISPGEAAQLAYNLLDREIITNVEQRRKLQVYRLEKIIEVLWQRVQKNADKDDVKNLIDVLDKLNVLLALNKENDAALEAKMHTYQLETYLQVLMSIMQKFMELAPTLMTAEQWQSFMAENLESAKTMMITEGGE
jgi:DNA-binding CsgD family transcriptional regulator